MISENKDWFCKSAYWGTWSRVLLRRGGDGHHYQIEITVHPGRSGISWEWDRVKQLRVRRHLTQSGLNDKWTHHLPDEIYQEMVTELGEEMTWVLVHADLLSFMDISYMENVINYEGGGHPLSDILLPVIPEFKIIASQHGVAHTVDSNKLYFMRNARSLIGRDLPGGMNILGGLCIMLGDEKTPAVGVISYWDRVNHKYVSEYGLQQGDETHYFKIESDQSPTDYLNKSDESLRLVLNNETNDYEWGYNEKVKCHIHKVYRYAEWIKTNHVVIRAAM